MLSPFPGILFIFAINCNKSNQPPTTHWRKRSSSIKSLKVLQTSRGRLLKEKQVSRDFKAWCMLDDPGKKSFWFLNFKFAWCSNPVKPDSTCTCGSPQTILPTEKLPGHKNISHTHRLWVMCANQLQMISWWTF